MPGAVQLFDDDFEDSGSDGQAADLLESLGRGNKALKTLMEYDLGSLLVMGSVFVYMEYIAIPYCFVYSNIYVYI